MPALDSKNPGVATVVGFGSLLTELLKEASALKQSPTVEPALSKADFIDLRSRVSAALSDLGGQTAKGRDAQDAASNDDAAKAKADAYRLRRFAVVETAAREIFGRLIAETSIDSPDFVNMWNLLDIVSILSDDEQCEPALLFWLVEELLDSQTIEGCRTMFDYLESRRDRITAKKFDQKKLVILRSCNELLRRLSRAEDTAFCGRVFIFMFQSFPLGDRSSVNLRGEYHVENITSYETSRPEEDSQMDVDSQGERPKDAANEESSAKGVSFDSKDSDKALAPEVLYPLFWSLQENLSQPLKLFQQPNFNHFKTNLGATVKAFESIPSDDDSRSSRPAEDSRSSLKRKRDADGHDATETFAPKYLTSRDLFELEISDLSFRRHVLVQALIILDFLLSLTPAGKERLATMNASNKSLLYSDELNEEDTKWTNEMKERIASYLRRGLDGPYFYRTVETVLARDKNWVIWKMAGCPPIQRDPVAASTFAQSKTAAQRMATAKRLRPMPLGAVSLDFLRGEDAEAAMEKLMAEERHRLPELDDFKRKIADDDFEIDMPTNEQTKAAAVAGKSSKSWRALRIAARTKLAAFDRISDPQKVDPVFEELKDIEDEEEDAEPVASEDSMPANRQTVIIAGPAAVGKSTLISKLMEQHKGVFARAVRHTTREPSEGEADGKTFHFVKAQEFNQLRDDDRLVEHGTRDGVDYGTSSKVVEAIADSGKVPIIELDIEAAQFAKDMGFAARYVLIKPPNNEALQERIEKSGRDAAALRAVLDKLPGELSESKTSELFGKVITATSDDDDDDDDDDAESSAKALGEFLFLEDGDADTQGRETPGTEDEIVVATGKAGAEAEMPDAPAEGA